MERTTKLFATVYIIALIVFLHGVVKHFVLVNMVLPMIILLAILFIAWAASIYGAICAFFD